MISEINKSNSSSSRDYSLLSKDESSAIKGILIILVVLGHNSIIMQATGLFPVIYSFHVYCFFVLPFMYGRCSSDANWRKLFRCCLQYWVTYIVLCIVCLIISLVRHRITWNGYSVLLRALFTGNQHLLTEYVGFGMLWFLPTISAVLFWHAVFFRMSVLGRRCFVAFCSVLWLLAALGITNYHRLGNFIPFALMPGLYHCLTGTVARWICSIVAGQKQFKWISASLSLFILLLWLSFRKSFPYQFYYLTWLVCPIAVMLLLNALCSHPLKSGILLSLGTYSYYIYLTHVFIYNILLLIVPEKTVAVGIILLVATLGISYALSKSVARILLLSTTYLKRRGQPNLRGS